MIANGSTVALLARMGRVTWLCHPRPDSAAIFADVLGGAGGVLFGRAGRAGGLSARAALPAEHDEASRRAGLG